MLDDQRVEVQEYGKTIDDLRALERYLAGLGIHKEFDRLGRYIKDIERLDKAVQAGNVSDLIARSSTRELAVSLHEGMILAEVAEHLKRIDPGKLVPILRAVLKGHPDPAAEKSTQGKNKARNVLFHLQVGAKFHKHGAKVWYPERLEDNPDVLAIRDSRKILTECKRPDSQSTIESNIAEAARQLTDELNARDDPHARGVIAISIARVLNPSHEVLDCTGRSGFGVVETRVSEIASSCKPHFRKILDTRIIGVLFHWATPVQIGRHPGLVIAQQIEAHALGVAGWADARLLSDALGQARHDVPRF